MGIQTSMPRGSELAAGSRGHIKATLRASTPLGYDNRADKSMRAEQAQEPEPAEGQIIRIAPLREPALSLPAAIETYLTYCMSRNLSPRTIEYYTYRLGAIRHLRAVA